MTRLAARPIWHWSVVAVTLRPRSSRRATATETPMGRETRILLGLLGLLAGLFVGVLSLKLLVPRPPAGAGPDVHGDVAFPVRQALVPPPAPATRAWDFTAAPPLVVTAIPPANQPAAIPSDLRAERFSDIAVDRDPEESRFPTPAADDLAGANARSMNRDPFVQPAAGVDMLDTPEAATPSRFAAQGDDPDAAIVPSAVIPAVEEADLAPQAPPASPDSAGRFSRFGGRGAVDGFGAADTGLVSTPDRSAPMPVAPVEGSHLVVNGDSWWTLAERAYGDGRLYRALYAWNRTLDPRVALLPGTRLDIPPVERLTAAWPGLVPTRP